jgi:hypothetical protein
MATLFQGNGGWQTFPFLNYFFALDINARADNSTPLVTD